MESILAIFPPELLRILISGILVIALVFLNGLVMVYFERKLAGYMQYRCGLMEIGWQGVLQSLVDGIKLISKRLVIPKNVDGPLYRIAPLLAFTPVVLPFLVVPFGKHLQVRDLNVGLIFVMAMGSLNVMAIFMAGWSSNNKYSMFGAMRTVAQNIAYEIPILLSLLSVVLVTNTFSMSGIVDAQSGGSWFILLQPVAFLIYLVAGVAETNRAPFDLPEAESELTAGFHTEYSGIAFGLFFLGEYANMLTVSCVATTLFLGGWHGPWEEYFGTLWFFLKAYSIMFFMIWIRWTFPRVRFDQLMNLAWKYLIPFALVNLLVTAAAVKFLPLIFV
ncbi:NADH-quinone oxidoreductase subunit NuoH [Desulforegula conservatrix]|uniref:NADH-quinone oxidoreductase subunit NuoH n=1 Tax=Desulforegula conservatrix TaxID=153026 RepID=UPI000409BAAC|nr:NADH-quinone oxidoreductase subunit NuoH [Desulforegula conservatrix]